MSTTTSELPRSSPPRTASATRSGARMDARAAVATALSRGGGRASTTRVTTLHSEPPLVLRPAIRKEREPWVMAGTRFARVCLTAGAAGPVGGDRLAFDVRVGAGSTLVLTEVSATLLLPGRDGAQSRTEVRVQVETGGTLVWLPEPVVAVRGCDHLTDVLVELAADGRLVMREELLLGRYGELPGRLRQRVRVRREGAPVYSQELDLGTPTGASPAVAAAHRAVGSLLVVGPEPLPEHAIPLGRDAAVLPLAAGGVLVSALADDNIALRRRLVAGLAALGPPWSTEPCTLDRIGD